MTLGEEQSPIKGLGANRSEKNTPASTIGLIVRLWRDYLSRYWRRLGLALVAMAAYAASASAIPLGLEWINAAFSGEANRFDARPEDVFILGPLLIAGLGAMNAISQYTQSRLSIGAALAVLRDIQNDMYARLIALDDAQLRAESAGQMISRFTNDPQVMRETLTRTARAVGDLLTLLGLCLVMIYYDWILFGVVLIVYGIIAWPISAIGGYLRKRSAETQAQAGVVASFIQESVAGRGVVKAYQLEQGRSDRAQDVFKRRFDLSASLAFLRAANEPVIFFVGSLALSVVIAVVAWRVMGGALNGAQFVSFIVALLMLSQPARGISTLNAVMQEGFAAFERMLTIIDAEPAIKDAPGASTLQVSNGAVTFKNVAFSYRADAPALRGVDLAAPAGGVTAIVGASGAGKSTLFSLMLRLYDLKDGAIEIDGANIAGVTLASLRGAIAHVAQDAFMFDDTVRANIALGKPGASDEEIRAAAKAAAADEFIEAMADGYDTIIGEGGKGLSGGERQRIALARAFLKDAPILLLDEATAALDAASEARVQEAVARLREGRTCLVIAHRLSTVREADLIAVMEEGRVIETGDHDSLTAQSSAYGKLAALQFAADPAALK